MLKMGKGRAKIKNAKFWKTGEKMAKHLKKNRPEKF